MSNPNTTNLPTAIDKSEGNVSRVLFSRAGGDSDQAQSGPRSLAQAPTKTQLSHQIADQPGAIPGALTPWGSPAREINEDTRISVGEMTVRVKEALRMGLVSRNAAGQIQMNEEAVAQVAETAEVENAYETDPLAPAPFASADDERIAVQVAGEVGPDLMEIGLEEITRALASGDSSLDIEALAETHGRDPAVLFKQMMAVTEVLSRQAEAYIGPRYGFPHSKMVQEMLKIAPRDVANAMRAHARTQNPRAWDSLAERYKVASKQRADDDAVAVFNQRHEGQMPLAIDTQARVAKEPLVTIDGVQMPMSFARARGFIR